jgi:hypothetical protein
MPTIDERLKKRKNGRDYRIRTCDLFTPSEARYQTAPSPGHGCEDK